MAIFYYFIELINLQDAIDDLVRCYLRRVDIRQVEFLRNDFMNKFGYVNQKTEFMLSIANLDNQFEQEISATRDKSCISCGVTDFEDLTIPPFKFFAPLPYIHTHRKNYLTSTSASVQSYTEDIPVANKLKEKKKRKRQPPNKVRERWDRKPFTCYPKRPVLHPIDPRYAFQIIFVINSVTVGQ